MDRSGETTETDAAPGGGERLIADAMLGRLARWLRALGHDTLHDPDLDDPALARLARGSGRLLLTRDRRLCEDRGTGDSCIRLKAGRPAAQLLELQRHMRVFPPLWRDRLFHRCMVCNAVLENATFSDVRDDLPPEVRADPRVRSVGFRRCPGCARIYWEGSHTRRMRRWLHRVHDQSVAEPGTL